MGKVINFPIQKLNECTLDEYLNLLNDVNKLKNDIETDEAYNEFYKDTKEENEYINMRMEIENKKTRLFNLQSSLNLINNLV